MAFENNFTSLEDIGGMPENQQVVANRSHHKNGRKSPEYALGHTISNESARFRQLYFTDDEPLPSFHHACEHCDEELVRWYLEQGITDVEANVKDKTGRTALMYACSNGFLGIVSLLRSAPVDVNLGDNEGNTPLIFAAQAGHSDIVRLLLSSFLDIDIDRSNRQGFSALLKACIQGRANCAKILLLNGASPNRIDKTKKKSALEWSLYCNRQNCVRVIKQFTNRLSDDGSIHSGEKEDTKLPLSLSPDDDSSETCTPRGMFNTIRRTLPKPPHRTLSARHNRKNHTVTLLGQHVENIVRTISTPVIPESAQLVLDIVNDHKIRKKPGKVIIPRVEVTMIYTPHTSYDDNWMIESKSRSYSDA